jgi:hypothetical protein
VCKRPIEVEWPEVQQCAVDPNYACATKEQWAASELEDQRRAYATIMRTIAGEPDGYRAGCCGWLTANIARQLIDERPELARPEKWFELLSEAEAIFKRRHVPVVTITDDIVQKVRLAVATTDRPPH